MNEHRLSIVDASTGRNWLAASIALFAVSRLLWLCGSWPEFTDVHVYFGYAQRAAEMGQVPYRDFTFEYPPLAWDVVAPAEHLTSSTGELSYVRYRHCFRWLMGACDLLAFVLFWSVTRERAGRWHGPLCCTFVVATGLCGYMLYERLDLGLLVLLMGWAYAWQRGLTGERGRQGWSLASYALLGLGICYKLVPLVMAPFLRLSEWRQGGLSRLAPALGILTLTVALAFAPLYPSAGNRQFAFLEFHRSRGIQVESLYATVLTLASYAGVTKSAIRVYWAHEIVSPWAAALTALSRWLLLGFAGVAGLGALVQGWRFDRQQAYRLACFVLIGTVALANVLSPQYFIWLIPVAMLLAVELAPGPAWKRWLLLATMLALAGLTALDFPLTYFSLVRPGDLQPPATGVYVAEAIVGVRNFVFAALVIWLGVQVVHTARMSGRTASGPSTAK